MRVMPGRAEGAQAVLGHARIVMARPFGAASAGLAVCAGLLGRLGRCHGREITRAREGG